LYLIKPIVKPWQEDIYYYISSWEWSETWRCFNDTGFQLCFRIRYWIGASKPGETESEWKCSRVNLLGETQI